MNQATWEKITVSLPLIEFREFVFQIEFVILKNLNWKIENTSKFFINNLVIWRALGNSNFWNFYRCYELNLSKTFSKWTRERQNSTDEWSYAVQIQKAYVQDIAHDHINLLFEGTQPKPDLYRKMTPGWPVVDPIWPLC